MTVGVYACFQQVASAQCVFLNKPENGSTYYPRTTNQTMGIGVTAYARFEVKNTASYVWDVCGFSVYDTQLSGYPSTNTGTANWYNDDFCIGYGGNYRSSSSQYLGVDGWPSTFNGLEYVQINPYNCAGWANYGSATLNYRCVPPASPTVGTPGTGTWNIYCYDAGDNVGGNGAWTNNYSGYYTDNTLNFDTQVRWNTNGSPYDANGTNGSAYVGCYILADYHSWRAVRTGITCGVYQLQVLHDDIGQILINGTTVYNNAACCATADAGTYAISATDVIEYRVSEGLGASNGSIIFNTVNTTLTAGSITYGGDLTACAGYDPPAFGNGGGATGGSSAAYNNGTSTYQWQQNGIDIGGATGLTYDPAALAAGTYVYRRRVTDKCGNVAYTNTFTINIVASPTVSISGATSVCEGGSVTLTATATGGSGTTAYQWRRNGTNVGTNSSSYTTDNLLLPGTYNYDVVITQSTSNCNATSAVHSVTVNALPAAVIVSAPGTYCGSATLTASGGTGGTIYYQGTTAGGTGTGTPSTSQTVTASGTYYFRAQSGAGCWGPEGSAAVTIQTPVTYYADADGDGYGNPAVTVTACTPPPGYVTDNTDCDDTNSAIHPGAPEICDGLDNNCNGLIDEGVLNTYYADADGDGYGDPASSVQACSPPPGYVSNNTDCDDTNSAIHPGAVEICGNGIDEDCDGIDPVCGGLVWSGLTGTDWNTPTNWNPNGIPNNCATDVTIPLVANQPAISGANFNVGNMTVSDGVVITIQNGFKLNVCGNVNVSGTTGMDVAGGEISFIGSAPQTVTGTMTADNVMLNNASGLTVAVAGSLSASRSVSLQSGVLTTNNNVTLLSDVSGTAYLDDFSLLFTGSVNGNIHVQRYNPIGLPGFRQLGTPVQMPDISGVSGFTPSGTPGFIIPDPSCNPNYVAFNSPYGNWMRLVEDGTVQFACHQSLFEVLTSGAMTSGRGYYMDVPGNSTLTFTGVPTTGIVSYGLTHANAAVTDGWNQVSNPYPSPLAWELLNVPLGVDAIGKIWVTSGTYTGTFQDLDPSAPGIQAVAIGQAFQVRVTVPGTSVPFIVDNLDRTVTPPTYLFAGGDPMTLNIDLLGHGFADLTKVRFIDGATNGLDALYDSPKVLGNANQPMVYTVWNGKNYSTNSYAQIDDVHTLPLGVRVAQSGEHVLSFSNTDQFPASAFIYLEDTETGLWQDVRLNGTYAFTHAAGTDETRFMLHFFPPIRQTATEATCETGGTVVLTEQAPATWNYVLTDASHATVNQGQLNGTQTLTGLPAGNYTLTLTEQSTGYVAVENVTVSGATQVGAQALASLLSAEPGQPVQFTAQTQGANVWNWSFGDQNTSTEQNPLHIYNAAGTYNVTLTASNTTCLAVSHLTVSVSGTAAVNETLAEAGVKMWNDGNTVYLTFGEQWNGKTVFTLYDIQGRKIFQKQFNDANGSQTIDCGVLAPGTYTAGLDGNGKTVTRKMVMGVK